MVGYFVGYLVGHQAQDGISQPRDERQAKRDKRRQREKTAKREQKQPGQGKATDTTPIHRLRTKATETMPNQRPRTKPTNDNKTNHGGESERRPDQRSAQSTTRRIPRDQRQRKGDQRAGRSCVSRQQRTGASEKQTGRAARSKATYRFAGREPLDDHARQTRSLEDQAHQKWISGCRALEGKGLSAP